MQAHGLHWSLKLGSLHSKEQQWPKKPDLASMQPPAHIKPMVMEEVSDDEQKSDGRCVLQGKRKLNGPEGSHALPAGPYGKGRLKARNGVGER